jgi:hypothetical protein
MEEETSDPIGPIGPEMVKSILVRRYWNYDKICAWIETLPQIQDLRKEKEKGTKKDSIMSVLKDKPNHYSEED